VTFDPTVVSSAERRVTLTISFAPGAASQSITLTGSILVPAYSLSPASLTFCAPLKVASAPQTVTLTNTSQAQLTVSSVTVGGTTSPFTVATSTCSSASVAAGGSAPST
jgi:hypothetical protein